MTMDSPIERKALFAQTRVQQALESGAHYIDADDVREALDGFKGALDCQFGVHNDLLARIADMEVKLAKARASTGGSRELVAAAISIRDRLVDYFRYVAEGLPLERQAEANERAQALINALGLLANDLEAGRLADQCTRLHRNQLQGELDEARAALDASQGQARQLDDDFLEEYISHGFDVLTGPAIGLSARKACLQLAEDYGVSYRHVWRILKAAP